MYIYYSKDPFVKLTWLRLDLNLGSLYWLGSASLRFKEEELENKEVYERI